MIGVTGQYVMTISIGKLTDFIREEDLQYFAYTATVGGNLPEFQMEFMITNPDHLGYFNERHSLTVQMGKTTDKMIKTMWKIGYAAFSPVGDEAYRVNIKGVLSALGFANDPHVGIYKGTSEAVIRERALNSGFQVETLTSATDTMNWIQAGISDWEFIQQTYVRYWADGTSPAAIAVLPDNRFRMMDLRQLVNSKRGKPDWTLYTAKENLGPTDLVPSDGVTIKQGNTVLNQWAGFGRQMVEESIVTGTHRVVASAVPSDETLFGSAGLKDQKPSVANEVQNRQVAVELLVDDNVHANWNQALMNNQTRLARSSSNPITFSVNEVFRPVNLLDVINFIGTEIKSGENSDTSTFNSMYSGLYVVEAFGFKYANRQIAQSISMTRDANADQKV